MKRWSLGCGWWRAWAGRPVLEVALLAAAIVAVPASQARAGDDAEVARRRTSARAALEAADADAARHHLARALELAPGDPDAIEAALGLDAGDPERRALWALHATLAGVDASGRFSVPRSWPREATADVALAADLAKHHAKAAKAVRSALGKVRSGDVAERVWLTALLRELAAGAPALADGLDDDIAEAASRTAIDPDKVVAALLALAGDAHARGDLDVALEAARTVRGLHQQAGQADDAAAVASGPAERAARLIAMIRRELREREIPAAPADPDKPANPDAPAPPDDALRVWTVDELDTVPPDEVDAWSQRHRAWSHPGLAESPERRYRVETVCGHATLRAVAGDVETQHARLAAWFGDDPFTGRQGLIRVSPDYREFEGEGQPFWWAAGYQSGDLTNLIARFSSREALARTLTHELTHRFDQALLPGMPAWLVEGRATFTETGSLAIDSAEVREEVTAWGRLWETSAKGYGSPDGLRKLLRGEVDDYRHNYDAGYSLFTFLRRFRGFEDAQDAPDLLRPRLDAYLHSFAEKPRTEAVARFTAFFCDGRDGRPAEFDDLAQLWQRFVNEGGSGATPAAAWKQTWQRRARQAWKEEGGGRRGDGRIFDRPTFRPSRTRHDKPDHGQYHALAAARLLASAGRDGPALAATRWALAVDEPAADSFAWAAELSVAAGDAESAWFERAIAHQLDPRDHSAPDGRPAGGAASAARLAADVVDAYGEAQAAALAAGHVRLAWALRADRDRLALRSGLPPLGEFADPAPPVDPAVFPERDLPVSLVLVEPDETFWAPLDSRPGRWHVSGADAIELGRSKEGAERTGALRDAGLRRTFVEARPWMQGDYVVRTRVRFVSAYADGELVVGKSHRDRGVRVRFQGGDWGFAVGNRDATVPLQQIAVSVSDLGAWDSSTSSQAQVVVFPSPRDVFVLEVEVVGAYVRVLIDGEVRITHRRPTGAPVEGRVGFGLGSGVLRFEEPTTGRLRTLGASRAVPGARLDAPLDPAVRADFPWTTVVGRRVAGLPACERATLLLWFPAGTPRDQVAPAAVALFETWFGSVRDELRVVVALPPETPDDDPWLTSSGDTGFGDPLVLRHSGHAGLAEAIRVAAELPDGSVIFRGYPQVPVWLMLDDRGVVRSAAPYGSPRTAIDLARALAGR